MTAFKLIKVSNNLNEPRPNLIVANIIKGKGIDFFENKMNGITQF